MLGNQLLDVLPKYIYHTMYYSTRSTDEKEALTQFVDRLIELGDDEEFINSLDIDLIVSKKTGEISIIAMYHE